MSHLTTSVFSPPGVAVRYGIARPAGRPDYPAIWPRACRSGRLWSAPSAIAETRPSHWSGRWTLPRTGHRPRATIQRQ
ncbi:hypothetical protein DSL92_07650 [Billgrantia gudaonensis]|uniref:Uncharacterized protein n=1 Tax=Billgrantia gudaonensis TaxID=376427 RepID=A0A432JH26_9GAMM|nr:hypothetical protein DSL92_07650 [Halomonas gudaonensis]